MIRSRPVLCICGNWNVIVFFSLLSKSFICAFTKHLLSAYLVSGAAPGPVLGVGEPEYI